MFSYRLEIPHEIIFQTETEEHEITITADSKIQFIDLNELPVEATITVKLPSNEKENMECMCLQNTYQAPKEKMQFLRSAHQK